jgi:hypothetical protein
MSVPGQQSENTYVVHSPISDASARNLEAELTSSGRLVHADWMNVWLTDVGGSCGRGAIALVTRCRGRGGSLRVGDCRSLRTND